MGIRDKHNLVVLALALAVTGLNPAVAGPIATSDAPASAGQGYILGPEDVVEVELLGQGDFHVRAPIGADGSILLPYLGKVPAADKTSGQLSADIAQALEAGGYYAHPVLSVQIVSRVGGVKEGAADFLVVRTADGAERRYLISALATGGVSDDPLVAPGDKIFSPKAALFYVSGQVKTPGAYPMSEGMTVRMAIGRGGGLSDLGTDRAVSIRDPSGRRLHLGLDDKIAPGDVIVVGERLF